LREELGDKQGIAASVNSIGEIYKTQGDTAKALECYNKSLKIQQEISNKEGMVVSYINIGTVNQIQNNIPQLEKNATNSYTLSKELGFPMRIKSAASLMKDLYVLKNNYNKSDEFIIEIIDIDNKDIILNFEALSEKEQEKYFQTVETDYMDFNSYALKRKEDNPEIVGYVYNNSVKNKGLLLKSSTAMRNAILSSKNDALIDNYYKWIHIKKQIAKLYSKGEETKALAVSP